MRNAAIAVALLSVLVTAVPSAQAAGGVPSLPVQSAQTNDEVDAIAVSGNIAYIGGLFTSMRPAGTSSGGTGRSHLGAINLTTGQMTSWNPGANGDVTSIAVSPDGSTVFVGGVFTTAGGASRRNIAAIDAGTGAATTWKPGADNEVGAMAIANNRLYVGGKFSTIAGTSRTRLAAFDLPGLGLDTAWNPSSPHTIKDIAPAGDGSGRMIAVGGDSANHISTGILLALDGTTGAASAWKHQPEFQADAVAVTSTQVFLGMGGPGGKVESFKEATGARQWTAQFDGDVQGIATRDGLVYAGGHFIEYCIGGTGSGAPFQCTNPLDRSKLAALRASDGAIDSWDPRADGALGSFTVAVTGDGLVAGGQMTTYGLNLPANQQVHQQGFAHFVGAGDSESPTQPTNLSAAATGTTTTHLTWTAATDNVGVTNYRIYRNGVAVDTIGNVTAYDDSGLTPNTTYTYTVTALDAANNESAASNAAQVTTDPLLATVFSDGFETGDMSKWTNVKGMTVQTSPTFAGTYAARSTTTGTPQSAYTTLGSAATYVNFETHFQVVSQGLNNVDLLVFRTSTGTKLITLALTSSDRLRITNNVTGTSVTAPVTATQGSWHDVIVHVVVGTSGRTDVTFDGSAIAKLTQTWNIGTTQVTRLQLGDSTSGRTSDTAFDDVVVQV